MACNSMYIPNDDTQNKPFSRLKLVGIINLMKQSIKIHWSPQKLLRERIRKCY